MPIWLLRFFLGLSCRPEDRDALYDALPELFDEGTDLATEDSALLFWDRLGRSISLAQLRNWAVIAEQSHPRAQQSPRVRAECPAPDCPLRERDSQLRRAELEKRAARSGTSDYETSLYSVFDLVMAGGPGRSDSVRAFLDLVRKTKSRWCQGPITEVYITDRYIFADVGTTGTAGGYNMLLEYLSALGLGPDSHFTLYLPGWPRQVNLRGKHADSLAGAWGIVKRLVAQKFPKARIMRLPQHVRYHDRLYLTRDASGKLSGLFGPSLNGLRSQDIALMGAIDDERVLRRLDYLLYAVDQ